MSNVTIHNIADTIREKVKDYIIEAIPKEQFDGLIKTQWDAFFKDNSDNWNKRPSEFSLLVNTAIKKEIEIKISESVQSELKRFAGQQWDNTGQRVIKDAVEQYAPMFIQGLARQATQEILTAEAQRRGIY